MHKEFRQDIAGTSCLCSAMFGTQLKDLKAGAWNHWRLNHLYLVADFWLLTGDLIPAPHRPTPFGLPCGWVWTSLQDGDWVARRKLYHFCFIASEVKQCPFCLTLFIFIKSLRPACTWREGKQTLPHDGWGSRFWENMWHRQNYYGHGHIWENTICHKGFGKVDGFLNSGRYDWESLCERVIPQDFSVVPFTIKRHDCCWEKSMRVMEEKKKAHTL